MRKRTITVRIDLRRNPMRIMFQPDALHHQAPSDHTRHHHTLSGPPEKTSGFNIPNAPTASLHAARCTLHAARAAYNHKAAAVGEIIASSIKTRYRIAPIPNTDPLPTFPFFPPPANAPRLRSPSSSTPLPHQGGSPHTSSCTTPDPETQRIQATSPTPPSPHLPRHTSLATPPPLHLSRPHPPRPPRPKPSTAASMHSHIGPRPTRIQRFLHMPPTQPH